MGLQRENHFVNLKQRRDRQRTLSVIVECCHTDRTEQSHSRTRSHVSHDQEARKLQLKIDRLHKRLRHREHERRNPSPPSSDGLGGSRDHLYRHRSRTLSSESYSAS